MKQTKIFCMMALAAMTLLATSCAQDDDPHLGKVPVTFYAHLPETIESRAIGDGTKARALYFRVYDEDGKEYIDLRQDNLDFDKTNVSKVTTYLTPGHTYKFAFWAQSKGNTAYNPGNADMVNINYENAKCNDDTRDAFHGWIPDLKVTEEGNVSRNIILDRKLTQVNVGLSRSGYEAALKAGVDLNEYDSEVTIKNVDDKNPSIFNRFDLTKGAPDYLNRISWVRGGITFAMAPKPDELLHLETERPKNWYYLAMNYFVTRVDQESLVNVTLKLRHKTNGTVIEFPTFNNIPVKGNDRTNILLDAITEDVDFDVVIDQNFDNLDYNIFLDEQPVATADELVSAVVAGGQYKLQNDITLTDGTSLSIPQGKDVRLDLNGHTLTNSVSGNAALINRGTLTLLGGAVVNGNQDAQGSDALRNEGGTLTIMSGNYGSDQNRGAAVRNNGGTVTIDGGTFASIDRGLNKGWAYVFINNADDATMIINNAQSDCDPNGMFAANAGTLTVNGGTYRMGNPDKPTYYLFYAENGIINVTGGNFTWTHGKSANVYQYLDKNGSGAINIASGVTINATYK